MSAGSKKGRTELKKLDNTLKGMLTNSNHFILRAAKPGLETSGAASVPPGGPAAADFDGKPGRVLQSNSLSTAPEPEPATAFLRNQGTPGALSDDIGLFEFKNNLL